MSNDRKSFLVIQLKDRDQAFLGYRMSAYLRSNECNSFRMVQPKAPGQAFLSYKSCLMDKQTLMLSWTQLHLVLVVLLTESTGGNRNSWKNTLDIDIFKKLWFLNLKSIQYNAITFRPRPAKNVFEIDISLLAYWLSHVAKNVPMKSTTKYLIDDIYSASDHKLVFLTKGISIMFQCSCKPPELCLFCQLQAS